MKQKLFVIMTLLSLLVASSGTASAQGSKPPATSNDPAALPKSLFMSPAAGGYRTEGIVPPTASADLLVTPTLINGNFDQGPGFGWTVFSTHGWPVIQSAATNLVITPHSGSYAAWLGGDDDDISYITQDITIINPTHLQLWYWIGSQEYECTFDYGYLLINMDVIHTWELCGPNNTGGWVPLDLDLSGYSGQTVSLTIGVQTDEILNSNLFIDDVSLYGTFADVPYGSSTWSYIEGLYDAGVTGGCSTNPLKYCPGRAVTREQMAVFLLRGKYGSSHTPPPATGVFEDVVISSFFAPWIEQMADEGITGGCSTSPLKYCPTRAVTREQMAIFLLRAKYGSDYTPPPATGMFSDVPLTSFSAPFIEQLANEGITGGCGGGMYCPTNPVTRAQMAIFLVRTFNLPVP